MADDAAIQIALKFLDQASTPMQKSLSAISSSAKSIESQFLGLTSVIQGFIGAFTAKAALKIGMEYETSISRMKNVFQEGSTVAIQAMQRISEASHHYFTFPELAQAAVRIQDTMFHLGLSEQDMEKVIEMAASISRAKGLELEDTVNKLNMAFQGSGKAAKQTGMLLSESFMHYEAFGGRLTDLWTNLSEGDKAWWRLQEGLTQSAKYTDILTKETNTLSGAWKAFVGTLTDEVGPAIANHLGFLTRAINLQRQLFQEFGQLPEASEGLSPGGIRRPTPKPTEEPAALLPAGYESHVTPIKGKEGKGGGGAGKAIDPLKDWNKVLDEGRRITEQNFTATEQYGAELDKLNYYISAGAISQDTYSRAVQKTWDELVKANEATEGWKGHLKTLEEGGGVFKQTRTEAEQYSSEIERLSYLLGYGAINQDTFNRAVDAAKNKFGDTTNKMSEFAVQAAHNIQNALGDQLYNVLQGNFDSIGQSFLQMIEKMLAQAAAAQIADVLFGDFGKSKAIGGIVGTLFTSIVGAFAGGGAAASGPMASYGISGRAGGGSVSPGTPYLIGERGPELFLPKTSGTVIPNNALSGGGSPNVNVTIKNESGQKVEAESSGVQFDGQQYHASISLRLLKTNPGYRDAMRGLLAGR
jgi:hypothetical protein